MAILAGERERRMREQQVTTEVAKRMLSEAEAHPEDRERVQKATRVAANMRSAAERVEQMLADEQSFVRVVLQEHVRIH